MPDRADVPPENSGEPTDGETRPTTCHVCGADVNPTAWHPVATRTDDEGEFHLHLFCSLACRREWEDR